MGIITYEWDGGEKIERGQMRGEKEGTEEVNKQRPRVTDRGRSGNGEARRLQETSGANWQVKQRRSSGMERGCEGRERGKEIGRNEERRGETYLHISEFTLFNLRAGC